MLANVVCKPLFDEMVLFHILRQGLWQKLCLGVLYLKKAQKCVLSKQRSLLGMRMLLLRHFTTT